MTEHARHRRVPSPPSEVVASFSTWDEAQRAVDFLADRRFALRQVSILTTDLSLVGRGPLAGYGPAAMDSAVRGATSGALVGFGLGMLGLATPAASEFTLALAGVTIGAFGGGLLGLCQHALWRSERSATSIRRLEGRRYDILATAAAADAARRHLDEFVRRSTGDA
jgi:hypothetical protein